LAKPSQRKYEVNSNPVLVSAVWFHRGSHRERHTVHEPLHRMLHSMTVSVAVPGHHESNLVILSVKLILSGSSDTPSYFTFASKVVSARASAVVSFVELILE